MRKSGVSGKGGVMGLAETEVEVRAWLDRLTIQDLIYRHSDALTRADWRQVEALYALDAIWETPALGLRYDGVAALIEMLGETSSHEVYVQTPHAPVINLIAADEAQATTTIHEWLRGVSKIESRPMDIQSGDQVNLEAYGVYYDDIARIEGEWRFTHRVYVPIYIGAGAVMGDVVTPRSDLLRSALRVETDVQVE
jgi:hypothetical protein